MALEVAKNIAEIAQSVATALGILAAGFWALFNFGLARASAPQVAIDLRRKSIAETKEQRSVILAIDVQNTGRTKIDFRRASIAVKLFNIEAHWSASTRISEPLDFTQDVYRVLVDHDLLEPGEKYHEEIGFVVTGFDFLQVALVFVGSRKFQTWEANYIFELACREGDSRSEG